MDRPRIFVSAVSSELSSAREWAAAVLNGLGYDTVTEKRFSAGYGELRRWLAEQIDACEGVIQLVGEAYGAEPPPSDDPQNPWPDPAFGRCSYTQYELLYAWHRAKPATKRTWVILMGPDYPRDRPLDQLDLPPADRTIPDPAAYQAERRALQRAYLDRLIAENHLRLSAANETDLENLLLKLKNELAELRAGEQHLWGRLSWENTAIVAILLLLGGGGWLGYDRIIASIHGQSEDRVDGPRVVAVHENWAPFYDVELDSVATRNGLFVGDQGLLFRTPNPRPGYRALLHTNLPPINGQQVPNHEASARDVETLGAALAQLPPNDIESVVEQFPDLSDLDGFGEILGRDLLNGFDDSDCAAVSARRHELAALERLKVARAKSYSNRLDFRASALDCGSSAAEPSSR